MVYMVFAYFIYQFRTLESANKRYTLHFIIFSVYMKNYNAEVFQPVITNDPRWIDYWNSQSVTDIIILENLNAVLPKRRLRICSNNPEWFTNEVLSTIKLKNKIFLKAKNNPGNRVLWDVYLDSKII